MPLFTDKFLVESLGTIKAIYKLEADMLRGLDKRKWNEERYLLADVYSIIKQHAPNLRDATAEEHTRRLAGFIHAKATKQRGAKQRGIDLLRGGNWKEVKKIKVTWHK